MTATCFEVFGVSGPKGPTYGLLEISGFSYHTSYGFWNQKPQILGTWTVFWEAAEQS